MSFPTSHLCRNSTPPLKRENTAGEKTYNQSENGQKITAFPTRRNFDVTINNIESMTNQIGSLLSVVKNNKCKNQMRNQLYDVSNQKGFLDYKRKINNLQKLQEAYEIKEEQLIPEKNAIKYHQRNIYEKKVRNYLREDNLATKVDYDQLQDKIPVSRPSGAITPPKVSCYARCRSPLLIHRPNSKYINENYLHQKPVQVQVPKQQISREKAVQQKKFNIQNLNLNKKSEGLNQKRIPHKPVEKIEKQIVKKEQSFQIKHTNQPKRPVPRNAKLLQKIQDQRERRQALEKKFHPEDRIDEKVPKLMPQKQEETQTALSLKKLVTFIEIEQQDTPSPIQDIPQIVPSQRHFQIKVYPCDLNKETVKVFIADRLASVVKIDNQFTQLKKIFMVHQFEERLRLPDKKVKLLRVLWDRGLMIDQGDLEYTINFDIDTSDLPEKRIQFNNFSKFLELFVDKYLQAEYEWQKNVFHMLTVNEIQSTFFKPVQLDLQNKGYLRVENLACFINLYASDTPCFSNKEVAEVFARFCRHEPYHDKLSYQGFLNIISRRA